MPATVSANNRTVVHKSSGGVVNLMPDVCLTPAPPGPPVPIPYPNIALSQDTSKGSTTVKADGNPMMLQGSVFSKSTGDEAGSVGGVVSGVTKGKAQFVNYSFDVLVEGKNLPRLGDSMIGNQSGVANTPPMPEIQPPSIAVGGDIELEREPLKIKVIDSAGNAIPTVKYILKLPDGTEKRGETDASGKISIPKTLRGAGCIVFPDYPGSSVLRVD